jgi:hypothetical protein
MMSTFQIFFLATAPRMDCLIVQQDEAALAQH